MRQVFFRFSFLTGITKFQLTSPLSGINSIKDITFNQLYSQICGFLKLQIESTFH
ncbi:MAG: AAA family ATPase [Deltaproteobacteria bacterium]|nr:AAA family ATPase [Deltaproteobacteria bacterium]